MEFALITIQSYITLCLFLFYYGMSSFAFNVGNDDDGDEPEGSSEGTPPTPTQEQKHAQPARTASVGTYVLFLYSDHTLSVTV